MITQSVVLGERGLRQTSVVDYWLFPFSPSPLLLLLRLTPITQQYARISLHVQPFGSVLSAFSSRSPAFSRSFHFGYRAHGRRTIVMKIMKHHLSTVCTHNSNFRVRVFFFFLVTNAIVLAAFHRAGTTRPNDACFIVFAFNNNRVVCFLLLILFPVPFLFYRRTAF